VLRGLAVAALTLARTAQAADVDADRARGLLTAYKCYICHADDVTKAGPAYVDVAAAYHGDPDAVGRIAAIIRRGQHGGGPWHMPPHPEVSKAEAQVMARYILSLDPDSSRGKHTASDDRVLHGDR
jgi:cytochrome c